MIDFSLSPAVEKNRALIHAVADGPCVRFRASTTSASMKSRRNG